MLPIPTMNTELVNTYDQYLTQSENCISICCSCYCNNNADTSYNVYHRTSAGVLHTVTQGAWRRCTVVP